MAISEHKLERLQEQFGFDRLTAWRHLRDQERARRAFSYRDRQRIFEKW
jgi:hypothetical protein